MASRFIFSLVFVLSLLCQNILAQEVSNRTLKMKEINVIALKRVEDMAVTKTVVDSIEIAQSASGSLSELLTKSTPAFVKTYGQGSVATISFRGTGASHTQVEWNGININNPMLGQVDFSQIPVWFIDNIELYHGGSSLQNSSGALGGSISIGTKPHWGEKYHAEIVQSVASFGKYQTMVSGGVGNDKIQFKLRYLYERAENDFEYLNTSIPPFDRVKQTNAQYQKQAVSTDLYYNAGRGNFLTFNGWFHTSDRNLPTIMSYEGLGRDENDQTEDIRAVLKWGKFWNNVRTELSSGYSRTNMDYLLSNKTYMDWLVNISSRSYTNSFFNQYDITWDISKKSVLKVNSNLNYYDVSTFNKKTLEGYSHDRVEGGVTASFHHSFNTYISGYALLRQELTDGEFSPIMPSVGLASNPLNNDKLYIAINGTRNYHKPTLNDLYWQPGGNPNLRHEEGYSGDFTVEYKDKWDDFTFKVNASGYLSMIDDWIIWQPSEFMYWTAQNIQKVFSRGVEATFDLRYSVSGFDFVLKGNYAFTRTTNESDDIKELDSFGKQLMYIPLHKGNVLFSAKYRGFYLDYMYSCASERFTTSSNEDIRYSLPYYAISDLTLGKRVYLGKKVKTALNIEFKINNLFNKDYQAILWRAMPGINFQLQLKFDLNALKA